MAIQPGLTGPRLASVLLAAWMLTPTVGAAGHPPLMGVQQTIAHRGASTEAPENSLASVRRAIESGVTATEIDIRTTADGQLVLLHDATLDRTTNGSGPVGKITLDALRQLDAGSWFDERFQGERVPRLREVLALCRGQIDVVLDLKEQGEPYARAIAAEVREFGEPRRTIVGVRSVAQAKLFRELLPDARQLGLIPNTDAIEAFAEAGVETIRLWPRWLDDRQEGKSIAAERVRRAGAQLHLNGKTGARDEVQDLLGHQPTSLIADDPRKLVQTLTQLQAEHDGSP